MEFKHQHKLCYTNVTQWLSVPCQEEAEMLVLGSYLLDKASAISLNN